MNKLFSSFKGAKLINNLPPNIRKKIKKRIRDKATERVEEKILLSARKNDDFSEDELERMIALYVQEVENEYANNVYKVLLTALGLGYFV